VFAVALKTWAHPDMVEAPARLEAARTGRQDACPTGLAGQLPEISTKVRGATAVLAVDCLAGMANNSRERKARP